MENILQTSSRWVLGWRFRLFDSVVTACGWWCVICCSNSLKPRRSTTRQTWRLSISLELQRRAEVKSTAGLSSRQRVRHFFLTQILYGNLSVCISVEWLFYLCASCQIRLKIFWSREQLLLWQDWLWLTPSTSRGTGRTALMRRGLRRCRSKSTR